MASSRLAEHEHWGDDEKQELDRPIAAAGTRDNGCGRGRRSSRRGTASRSSVDASAASFGASPARGPDDEIRMPASARIPG
jgi:hypothetical protein